MHTGVKVHTVGPSDTMLRFVSIAVYELYL